MYKFRSIPFLWLISSFLAPTNCSIYRRHNLEDGMQLGNDRDQERAHLMVYKRYLNYQFAEFEEVVIQYDIYNIGSISAKEVRLNDDEALEDESKVMVAAGLIDVTFQNIRPNSNVSHIIIVKPLFSGETDIFNVPAVVEYYSGDEVDLITGLSSLPGKINIMSNAVYQRKYSSSFFEWAVFCGLLLPSLLIPFSLWYTSKSYYDQILGLASARQKKKLFYSQ